MRKEGTEGKGKKRKGNRRGTIYASIYNLYIVVYLRNDNICLALRGKWMRLLMY